MSSITMRSNLDKQAQKEQAVKKVQEYAEKSEKAFSIFTIVTNLIVATIGQIIQAI